MTDRTPLMSLDDLGDGADLTGSPALMLELAQMANQLERTVGYALYLYSEHHQLTALESKALQGIYELGDRAKPSLVAEHIRVPLSTMTGILSRLERRNFVERVRDPKDGRAFVLTLTGDGYARTGAYFGEIYSDFADLMQSVDEEELETIARGFRNVLRITSEFEENARKKFCKD